MNWRQPIWMPCSPGPHVSWPYTNWINGVFFTCIPAKKGCVTCSGSDQLLGSTLVNLADTLHDICQHNEEIKCHSFSQRKNRKNDCVWNESSKNGDKWRLQSLKRSVGNKQHICNVLKQLSFEMQLYFSNSGWNWSCFGNIRWRRAYSSLHLSGRTSH